MKIIRTKRIVSISSPVSFGFIPAAGSSRRRSFGSVASALAISSFRCSPYGRLAAKKICKLHQDQILFRSSIAFSFISFSTLRYFGNLKIPVNVEYLMMIVKSYFTLSRTVCFEKTDILECSCNSCFVDLNRFLSCKILSI